MSETLIRDLHSISPRYLRSIQLERDFNSPEALSGYCVTAETTRHLKRLGQAFAPESSQRAWRITGDFGSGKSSFALVLANLLTKRAKDLPKEISALRSEIGIAKNAPKLLPVLVTGSREALSRALLRELQTVIVREVDGRLSLPSKKLIGELLDAPHIDDRKAIAAVQQASRELVEKGLFGGVLLVIDELGKFLEYAALHPEQQDVYFLQSLGEAATRSGKNQITVLGLLHQGFAVYADKLSDSSQREWEKVAGRYEELVFNQPLNQVALLLSTALQVDVERTPRGWKGEAKQAMAEAVDLGTFGPDAGKTALKELAPSLFPLHPTVLPVLAKFFRRFGQNERSLFSFLLSSEPHALQDFATKAATNENIYRLPEFYDNAAQNFGHRLSGQSFRSHWNHIDGVIRSASGETEVDIALLKVVGILNVIESSELAPTKELISLALGRSKDLDERLHALTKRGILFHRGKGGYALWPHTSINLEQAYQEATEVNVSAPPIAEVVRDRLDVRPIVARRHYIKTGNLRYCSVSFTTVKEFSALAATGSISHKQQADGLVMVVLCESGDEQRQAIEIAEGLESESQAVIAISPPLDVLTGLALDLERWHWLERQTPELKDDRFAAAEVSRQIATISQVLDSRLEDYIGFRKEMPTENRNRIKWFTGSAPARALNKGLSLQTFLSDHFDRLFNKAPLISNELVNRHSISSAAAAARQQLFKRILQNGNEKLLGLPEDKAPPEKSMYLSVMQASGIHRETEFGWQIALPEDSSENDRLRVRPALEAFIDILDKTPDAKVCVEVIRNHLRSHPYGMRDGLIPVFYAVVLSIYESEIAVYEDGVFQPEIEENLLMRLAKRPETFEFQLCRITGVRKQMLSQFADILETKQAAPSTLLSIVRPLCLFVDQLPDYTKSTDQLSPEALALRSAILAAKEPAHLIFEAIPKALGFDRLESEEAAAKQFSRALARTLKELRRAFIELQERMAKAILESSGSSLSSLDDWRSSYSETAENLAIEVTDPELRAFCLKLIDDHTPQGEWLEALGSFLTRCPPSRWKDKNEKEFTNRFKELFGKFNRVYSTCFNGTEKLTDHAIRLAITERDGQERDRVVRLNAHDAKKVKTLENKIKDVIDDHSEITLTALSRIIWDILKEKE